MLQCRSHERHVLEQERMQWQAGAGIACEAVGSLTNKCLHRETQTTANETKATDEFTRHARGSTQRAGSSCTRSLQRVEDACDVK